MSRLRPVPRHHPRRRLLGRVALSLVVANLGVQSFGAMVVEPVQPPLALHRAEAVVVPPPAPVPPAPEPTPPPSVPAGPTDTVIGRLEIPALGLDVALHQGIELRVIDRGPSHWPGTALPGQPGNVVVAGHRVTNTRPFRYIDTLEVGDEATFTVDGVRSVYRVTGHEVVDDQAMWITDQTAQPTATLFACHPPGSAKYRWVTRLALAGPPTPV
ncbi:MAG: class E sortase [Actinomycetota bacterium]|nr:class E sortase [Actinomycetota bacterium]